MDLWAAIPELSVDTGPLKRGQVQPERVRAERAAPAPAARRVEAVMSGICTSMAQESALEAYNSGRRAAAGGVWRTFLLAPSHDTECSLLAPAAAADKAHAALLAVRVVTMAELKKSTVGWVPWRDERGRGARRWSTSGAPATTREV